MIQICRLTVQLHDDYPKDILEDLSELKDIYIPHSNCSTSLEALEVHELIRGYWKIQTVVDKKICTSVLIVPNTFSFFHDCNIIVIMLKI